MPTELTSAPIFIGMPAYQGWELIEETLRSIRDQTFQHYRVVISVDGADERTAEICRTYTDPRISFVVQPERLGWAANLNWLMVACDSEFFCYWQQDDICATTYLEALHARLNRHPEAACAYADVQWFGGRFDRECLPSITGAPLTRVMTAIEKAHFAPFRGLIRTRALHAAGPIRLSRYDSRLEDLIWVAKLAAQGELHRVQETLYFKRVHRHNAHSASVSLPTDFRRAVWLEFGLGMLETALPLVEGVETSRLLHAVLERLILGREGRWLFYDPTEASTTGLIQFASDFMDAAIERFALDPWRSIPRLPDPLAAVELLASRPPGAVGGPGEQALLAATLRNSRQSALREMADREGRLEASFSAGETATCLLDRGWAAPEHWGVWSAQTAAALALPVPADGCSWRVSLRGHFFLAGAPDRICRAEFRLGDRPIVTLDCTGADPSLAVEFIIEPGAPTVLEIDLPDAASPAELGLSEDPRQLGIALISICLTRQSAAA